MWSLITFLTLVGALYKFAYTPLMNMAKARQDSINEAINDAEKLRADAEDLLTRLQAATGRGSRRGSGHPGPCAQGGREHQGRGFGAGSCRGRGHAGQGPQQIERDTNQALQKIREEVADLTIAATAKVARTGLSGEDQLRLIQEAINEIDLSKVSEN